MGSQQGLGGLQGCLSGGAEGEVVAATVVGGAGALEQTGGLEASEQLGDGGWGYGGTAGQLGADQLALGDRAKREVLGESEWWVVASQ